MQLTLGATTMTRLNPQTTPRHQLRAEKAARNREAALAAFIGKKAEIDAMLARLQALSDDHFNCPPRRGELGPCRHPRALRQPPEAHHRQRLQRRRTRRVIPALPAPCPPSGGLGLVEGVATVAVPITEPTMTKLSDTQTIILSRAAQREDRIALPLPENLRGGAATKVIGAMLAKGFLEEVDADLRNGEPLWRETGDGHGVTLVATDAGLAALGIEPVGATARPPAQTGRRTEPAPDTPIEADPAPKARTPRTGTKQAKLIEMLRAPDGATIDEIVAALRVEVAHSAGCACRRAEEEAGTDDHLGEGRGRAVVSHHRQVTRRIPREDLPAIAVRSAASAARSLIAT